MSDADENDTRFPVPRMEVAHDLCCRRVVDKKLTLSWIYDWGTLKLDEVRVTRWRRTFLSKIKKKYKLRTFHDAAETHWKWI